jgi:hypothetical protein
MKGAGFADVAAIQEHVTVVLWSIPKEAFADSFQKLYERCQQCVSGTKFRLSWDDLRLKSSARFAWKCSMYGQHVRNCVICLSPI